MALSAKQKEMRRSGIGASEIAVLVGLSKWSSPAAIFESKVRPRDDEETTLPMDLGNEFEDPIARVFAKRHNRFLARVTTVRHPRLEYALATPDRAVFLTEAARMVAWRAYAASPDAVAGEEPELRREDLREAESLAQVKSTTWRQKHEWGAPGTDEIPEWHGCQGQWEMGAAGMGRNIFVVLFDKDRLETYPLIFSSEIFSGLYEIGSRFMVDHVLAGVPPPPDASDRYSEFVTRWFPRETMDLAPAPEEFEALALRYAKLWTFGKRLEKHLKFAKNQLRAAIGERAGFESPRFGKVTWKAQKPRMTTDWRKVAEESLQLAGELLAKAKGLGLSEDEALLHTNRLLGISAAHAKPGAPIRPLRVTWKGEAKDESKLLEMKLDALEVGESEEEDTADEG